MNKTILSTILISLTVITSINGQEKRNFTFKNQVIEYYFFSNMTPGYTKFPNHQAKLIIVSDDADLIECSKADKIDDIMEARKEEKLYYYFKLPKLKNEKQYLSFFEKFIEENYRKDFFDRNTVSLKLSNGKTPFNCESLDYLNTYLSKLIVIENSELLECEKAFVAFTSNDKTELKTSIKYESITVKESVQKRKEYEVISQLKNWKKTFFFSVSFGQNFIDNSFKTNFDEETTVDISEKNTIWHFDFGYMFSNKIGGMFNFSFMSSNEQEINTSTFTGTGSGFAVFKLGVGIRYIPFSKKNWSIYSDLKAGNLNVRTVFGTGSAGGSNLTENSEAANYLGLSMGVIHRLGKVVFLKSNFEYTSSSFENNIGSISGFTGYTINLGLGFTF